MLNKRWITLPVVYRRRFASKAVFFLSDFEGFRVRCLNLIQGHPTTDSSYVHWKHFLGYPEYFQISRNAF